MSQDESCTCDPADPCPKHEEDAKRYEQLSRNSVHERDFAIMTLAKAASPEILRALVQDPETDGVTRGLASDALWLQTSPPVPPVKASNAVRPGVYEYEMRTELKDLVYIASSRRSSTRTLRILRGGFSQASKVLSIGGASRGRPSMSRPRCCARAPRR